MMRNKRGVAGAAAGALSIMLALTACAPGNDSNAADIPDGLITGPGISDGKIKIGHLTDLTGAFGPVGKAYLEGANLYTAEKNAAGGICGLEIELVVEDHGYDVQRAVTGYRNLKDEVVVLGSVLGGGMANAVLPSAVEDQMLLSPLTWPGSLLNGVNVLMPGPEYETQVANGTSWMIEEFGLEKGDTIGFVGLSGEFGEAVLTATQTVAEEKGISVLENWIAPTDTDFTAQVSNLKSAGAEVITMAPTAVQVGTILSTASAASFEANYLLASPGAFDPSLLGTPAKGDLEKRVFIASGQAPWSDDTPAAENVRKLYEESGSKVGKQFGIMTGYAQAQVIGQLLDQACEEGDLSRESILNEFKSTTLADTGGLLTPLNFSLGEGLSQADQTMILRPDSSVEGGLSVHVPLFSRQK